MTKHFHILSIRIVLSALLVPALVISSCTSDGTLVRRVGSTPSEDTCYAKGVSAAAVGFIDGHLIMAGGANFPGVPAAQGGLKVYYDAIWTASLSSIGSRGGIRWQQVGVLPHPMAYGVAVSDMQGMLFVGGCNQNGGLTETFRLTRNGSVLQCQQLPSLPFTLDNMAGALLDGRLYVVGGLQDGAPSSAMYALDLVEGEWFECASVPGQPRVQPVCAAQDGRIFVFGGYVQPVDSLGRVQADGCMVHSDGWCYNPADDSWAPVAGPVTAEGHPLTLTGGTAIPWGDGKILAVGGVNRNVFLGGIQGIFSMPDYMLHETEWYRFNPHVLLYDVADNSWQTITDSPLAARAGASLIALPPVAEDEEPVALLLGGELKPGVRSTDVTLIRP